MPVLRALTGRRVVVTRSEVGVRVDGARPDPAPGRAPRGRRQGFVVFEPAFETPEIEDRLRREYLPRFDPGNLFPVLRYANLPHQLALLAQLELLPVLYDVEALPSDASPARATTALPSSAVSLRDLLARAGLPLGFVIARTGDVLSVTSPLPATRCSGGSFLQIRGLERAGIRQRELRARLDAILARAADGYRKILADFVLARCPVSPAQLEGAEPLYRGPSLQVWLERSGERLTVRRRTGRFTLRTRTTARTFPPIEFRVAVELGPNGPRCGPVWTEPQVAHPFTGGHGDICLDGFTPTDDWWVRRVLAYIGRTESVLANPSNPSGAGGLRRLSDCPNPT